MRMKRLRFLLLDANVVIYLFEHRLWERLVDTCDIHLARTVIEEAHFYEDDDGVRHDFDVKEWKKDITIFDVPLSDVEAFCNRFDASYMEKLDPGEAESLAWLVSSTEDTRICSSDAIVFRVLGNLDRSEQGLSLEEVLRAAGLGRPLSWQFGKKFRDKWTAEGVKESLYGSGLTKKT